MFNRRNTPLISVLIFLSMKASAGPTQSPGQSNEEASAFSIAKLFFAARAAIGERTSFTDDPTSAANNREALIEAVKLSYERQAGEPLNIAADATVQAMWKSIEAVITKAMKGEYKGKWSGHPNFPGKLIPARFGNEVTKEFNSVSKDTKVKWTTSDEYLVNRESQADALEQKVIKANFKNPEWTQGKPYFESISEGGRRIFRYALPEYFKTSCMGCHGGEMGKKIHAGKSAAGSGTFGGLLSVTMKSN